MWFEPYYKEPHSADGRTFIEKRHAHSWEVWFRGVRVATWSFRRQARAHIRALKKGHPCDPVPQPMCS